MTDNTKELDEILSRYGAEAGEMTHSLKQALLDWHNKQTLELLDRLIAQQWSFGENDDALAVPTRYIKAECNKLRAKE